MTGGGNSLKYALISDIHGNYPALKAVMDDANTRGTNQFLFLGDYVAELPYPNECVNLIRSLSNAAIIRGNKEDYLTNLAKEDQSTWVSEQFAPMYWNVNELTDDNLNYLIGLPSEAYIEDKHGYLLYLQHSCPSLLGRNPWLAAFHSSTYPAGADGIPMYHDEYLKFSRNELKSYPAIHKQLFEKPKRISIFGHNHIQWHMSANNSLLINPGSCGLPCDGNPHAAYSILTTSPEGFHVAEYRVDYDIPGTIDTLFASTLFQKAEIWSRIACHEIMDGKDYISPFLSYVQNNYWHDKPFPADNAAWRSAAGTFNLIRQEVPLLRRGNEL